MIHERRMCERLPVAAQVFEDQAKAYIFGHETQQIISRTSSPVHVPQRPRDALMQSLCSLDSTMTTGAPVDARRTAMPSYLLRRDGICSQHGPSGDVLAALVSV